MRIKTELLDDMHFGANDIRAIDGYNKPFNFVMSAREWGKSTGMWLFKIFAGWIKDKRPWIYLTRSCVEISEALIETIFDTNINKWIDEPVKPQYKSTDFTGGIVDVCIDGEPFIRIVSLSIKLRRIKLATLRRCKGVFMDEYVIDPRSGEKYSPEEAFKIKEAYTTWRRECEGMLKCYFVGNPYSVFNPLFMDWGVSSAALIASKGSYLVGDEYVIQWANLPKRLIEHILKVNPLYQFDKDYTSYAVQGNAVNDANIPIRADQPMNFTLRFVLKVQGRYLGVFRGEEYRNGSFPFWVDFIGEPGARRVAFCFDLSEMVARTALVGYDERLKLLSFKDAMRVRNVEFSDVSAYYLCEEVFKMI